MILTTTPEIQGYPIKEYRGLITAEALVRGNFVQRLMAGISEMTGGRIPDYEAVVRNARDTAMHILVEEANKVGANAIVGIDIDYETLGDTLLVAACGTAVII